MFLIILRYKKELAEVDRWVPEHRAFLERHYAAGHLLLSGRQEPRTGGVILAQTSSRAQVQALIEQDPFFREQLADYEVIEWLPSMAAPALTSLLAP